MSCVGGEWGGKGYVWESRDYDTEYGVSVELIDVSLRQARVKIYASFADTRDEIIAKGSSVELGDGWSVHCDDVVQTMVQAKIRICQDEDPTPPTPDPDPDPADGYNLPLYGSTSVFGYTFTNTRLLCATSQAIIRPEGLLAKTLAVGGAAAMWGVSHIYIGAVKTPVIMGGIYVALKSIDSACTQATIDIFEDVYTEQDHDEVVETAIDDLEDAGFTVGDGEDDFTTGEVDAAVTAAEAIVASSPEEQQRQEDVKNGKKTPEAAEDERKAQIVSEAMRILFEDNFGLDIPSIVLAGGVDITGHAPKQNADIQIMAVKKLFGFDYLATDSELAKVRSDVEYKYSTTLELNEFGIIEVYARIPKEWWEVLAKDVETPKHTVFVLTPMILLALLAMLAMVLDKKYNFVGMFKKKRGKK